jgi:hypothetical protein
VKTGAEVFGSYGVNGGGSQSPRPTIQHGAVLGATPTVSVSFGTNTIDLNAFSRSDQVALTDMAIAANKSEIDRIKAIIDTGELDDSQAVQRLNEELLTKRQKSADLLEFRRSLDGVSTRPGPVR